jgi:glutamate 5-kinase
MVDVLWLVVGFAANACETWGIAHPGTGGMHMKVAAHVKILGIGYEQTIKRGRNVSEKSMELIEHKQG